MMYVGSPFDGEVSIDNASAGYMKAYQAGEAIDYNSFGNSAIECQARRGGYLMRKDYGHDFALAGELYVALKLKHQ